MIRLFTDFDGPIMDISERYYQVYLYCVAQTKRQGQLVTTLSKADFWALKRDRVPEVEIARRSGFDEEQAAAFAKLRRATVHTDEYFPYDQLAPGAVEALEMLKEYEVELGVMTMRHRRELLPVLEQYDLGRFFPETHIYCLDDDYVKTGDTNDKPLLMARTLAELPVAETVWMVGDTEADLLSAKNHNIPVIGVLSGIRNREQLAKYEPNYIVPDLAAAVEIFLEHTGLKAKS
ncbi:HAD family hydrolase [Leptolyngbya sp. FACHB-261]|nr:HAD family hydrolase [Leptolyngbya sp. FACHB-261]